MPFALLFVGALLIAAGVNGKSSDLFQLVKGDIESSNGRTGYLYWMVSILVIGALGYIEELKPFSRAFMALVVVVLILKEGNPQNPGGGFFQQLQQQLGVNPQSGPVELFPTSGAGQDTTLANIIGNTTTTELLPTSGAGEDTVFGNIIGR